MRANLWLAAGFAALWAGVAWGQDGAAGVKETDPWKDYVLAGKWDEGREHYRKAIIDLCEARSGQSFERLRELRYAYAVCRWFPAMAQRVTQAQAHRALAAALLANQAFTERFLAALAPQDKAAGAFEVLYSLANNDAQALKRHGELVIAFAVVWDEQPPPEKTLAASFQYFTSHARQMPFDPLALPWELSKHVADLRRPVEERVWALKRYGSSPNVGRLYDDIEYDVRLFFRGGERRESDTLTLEELRKRRGVCHERAVFGSDAGKCLGVPSVYVFGEAEDGLGHAWLGFVRKRGNDYAWDWTAGRLDDEKDHGALYVDPQTGQTRPTAELDMESRLAVVSAQTRRKAEVWRDIAGVLAEKGAKEAAVRAMGESLGSGVFDRRQWEACARLAQLGVYDAKEQAAVTRRFVDGLKSTPDLAVEAVAALVWQMPLAGADERVEKLFAEAAAAIAGDRDSVARLRLWQARYLEARDHRGALKAYEDALEAALQAKSDPLAALDNAARLLTAGGKTAQAAALHDKAVQRVRAPDRGAFAVYSTSFRIGMRLVALHGMARNAHAQDAVVQRLLNWLPGLSADERKEWRQRLVTMDYGRLNRSRAPAPLKGGD